MRLVASILIAIVLLLSLTSSIKSDATLDLRTNQERVAAGLQPLTTNAELQAIAAQRATEIVENFAHNDWIYSSIPCWDWAGENISFSEDLNNDPVADWMNSPDHRANILDARFTEQGSAVLIKDGVMYAVQIFRDPCETATVQPQAQAQATEESKPLLPNTAMSNRDR